MTTLDRSSLDGILVQRGESPTVPYLFLIMQAADLSASPARFCLDGVTEVDIARGERSMRISTREAANVLSIRIPDARISLRHASLTLQNGEWVLTDHQSKNGVRVDRRRVTSTALKPGALIEIGGTFFRFDYHQSHTAVESGWIDDHALPTDPRAQTLLPSLERQLIDLERIARSGTSILLLGETGTGKEVLANVIHQLSSRPGALVAVNCGALPAALVESELFGHRKGAFSGANEARLGFVRAADRGTLLIDEVGDLPAPAQTALLRVLQQREVTPVGEHRAVSVDLRVCAATHCDLELMVNKGQFRRDLLTRLEGYIFRLPALRERQVDLGLLMCALVKRMTSSARRSISTAAALQLLQYAWPGNVRELEKCLESALALAGDGKIELEHLPEKLVSEKSRTQALPARASEPAIGEAADLEPGLADRLRRLLVNHNGNVAAVARGMGKHPFQIHRWMKRFSIDVRCFRDAESVE